MARPERGQSNARPEAPGRASDQLELQSIGTSSLVSATVAPSLTWRNGRSSRIDPDTVWVQWSVVALVGLLGLLSFIVSFRALYDVAAWAGVGSSIRWAVPAFIDGAILTYSLAILVHRARGEPTWQSWLSLAAFTVMSIAANGAHAVSMPQERWWETLIGALVAAMAPLGLFVATEQLARLVVLRPQDREPAPAEHPARGSAAAAGEPAPVDEVPARAGTAPAPATGRTPETGSEARQTGDAALPIEANEPGAAVPDVPMDAPAVQSLPASVPREGAVVEEPAPTLAGQQHGRSTPDEAAATEEETDEAADVVPGDGDFSDDGFAQWVLAQRRSGEPITGPTAGAFLGVSERTGRNRIKELRNERPEVFEEVPA